jgi:hypothetical protein
MTIPEEAVPEGYVVVYCRSIRKNGRVIYPKKARVFRFIVKSR